MGRYRLLSSLKCLQCLLVVLLLLRESYANNFFNDTNNTSNDTINITTDTNNITNATNTIRPRQPTESEDTLAIALTSSLVLVILLIVVVFSVIAQPQCCKKLRRARTEVELVEVCPSSDKANKPVAQGEEGSTEHVYDVIRHPTPTIPEDTASEGSTDSLPVVEPIDYSGVYSSPYEQVDFETVGEYATLYATANPKHSAKNVEGGRNVGTDDTDKGSAPAEETVIPEAKESSPIEEKSTTESGDNASAKDMDLQQATATEEHNDST